MENFKDDRIPQALFHRLEQIGFTTPTPIQAQAIPPALEGRDILGSAQTGTGKTAAFGIPLITYLLNNNEGNALVLLPTRELATQVLKALQQFIGKSKISTALLIGGEPMPKQFNQLRANPRLVVGTPGRINDHLTRGKLKLNNTKFLVLDEVDRMLDMGFGIQLDAIAEYLTAKTRQTLMFSATLPNNIKNISAKYLNDPIRISVGDSHAPAANVKQESVKITDAEKYPRLLEELNTRTGSVIIFVKTKRGADRMADKLRKNGHKSDALHGDLRQSKRNRVISGFRTQNYRILVATDVAARGLDIPHIEHVINYDLPQSPEDYIHRIGRTARAGAEGSALNFLGQSDNIKWRAIQRLLNPDAKNDNDEFGGERKKSGNQRKFKNRSNFRNDRPEQSANGGARGKRKTPFGKPQRRATGEAAQGESLDRPQGGFKSKSAPKPYGKPKAKPFGKPKAKFQGKTQGKPQGTSQGASSHSQQGKPARKRFAS
ncbi:MAG: ATP-dependent RNA helicase [Alphaproteobacteria bacterium CG11_big_fil_rev_8_21_14_0_20_44_7]|nr:MAG: ATP-dependent RNA helicase [Alphaproteobacteria bacterium CG11_big_fil_rev_8_21_14_0_20_44_7]